MASRAIDTVITFRVLKLLTMKWEDHEAFGMGIIDEKGKRNKTVKIDSTEKKEAYTFLHRLVFNLKRLIELLPGGKSRLGSYAAALFLIKEHTGLTGSKLDKEVFKYLQEADLLGENLLEEFIPITKLETEKTFQLRRNMIIDEETEGERGDTLINSGAKPAGKVYGISLFRMYNVDKNTMMICSGHDLK
tara:strand:+ start:735 stop:1304 length:570 start_codon:yes stop_codon:yes gene_type:complete